MSEMNHVDKGWREKEANVGEGGSKVRILRPKGAHPVQKAIQ